MGKTIGLLSIAKHYTKQFRAAWDGNSTNRQDQRAINDLSILFTTCQISSSYQSILEYSFTEDNAAETVLLRE